MTVLILSLWASGVLLLIAFAVYRGRRTSPASLANPSAEMSDFEITELANRVRVATATDLKQQILRDPKTGRYGVVISSHSGIWTPVPGDGKPTKIGLKAVHVRMPNPGKSVL